jgi:DNA-binding SARP family transcriptional activator
MRVTLLGPVTATAATGPLALGGPRQRAVVAMLALAAPRLVTVDALIEGIWGGAEPANPAATLQVFIHNVRKALKGAGADGLLRYQAPGYLLDASVEVDARDFRAAQRAARDARDRGDNVGALAAYDNALSLWTGPALVDVRDLPFAALEATHLEQERLLTMEERIDVALALGHHAQEVASLDELVRTHPTRERLCGQLMTALYRCDRQADALQAYAQARERLADELGIDPGEALRQLELGILRQDPALAAPADTSTASAMTASTTPVETTARAVPASPTAPRARGRIPRPPTRTIGREDLVEHVVAVLSRPDVSVASLIGLGGTGKSRIAMVAAESARARALFDAVYFVEVTEATEADQLFREIALLFGADDGPDASASLGNVTSIASGLLVLDNLESLADGADFVIALTTAAPYLTVLVTSRLGLRLNREHEIPVPPLAVPDPDAAPADAVRTGAAELFVERVQASAPTLTLAGQEEQVCRVVRLLDGVPLALELAAARVRLLGLTGVEDGLRAGLDILSSDGAGPPGAPAHHRRDDRVELLPDSPTTPAGCVTGWRSSSVGSPSRRWRRSRSDLPNVLELLGELLDARLIRSVAATGGDPVRRAWEPCGPSRPPGLAGEPHLAEHRRHLAQSPAGPDPHPRPTAARPRPSTSPGSTRTPPTSRRPSGRPVQRGEVALATDLVAASTPWWLASGRAREGPRPEP